MAGSGGSVRPRFPQNGRVGVLALEVDALVERPCGPERPGERIHNAAELVRALVRTPHHRVTLEPEPDDRFGHPGTHLRLRAGPLAECVASDGPFWLWDTQVGPMESPGVGARMDLWVVDIGTRPVMLAAVSTPDTPRSALEELDAVVKSVEFVPGPG
ncbi:MAG TPA: hypothetical protein VFG72_08375 [Marmoricola sp.]|nr:hypothetical protein [Marmoricola sp.]